jgi:DNA-binding GntR family transcriptional regulator
VTRQGELAEEIRRRIIEGEFAPGSRLSEAALTERLEVSRNTLREAFRVLAEQGLIEHVPNRGVTVASPSTADVIDIYRARRAIECAALEHADPHHPAVEDMRAACAESRARLEVGEWPAVGSANMAFHEAIVALADSPRLSRTFRDLAAELRLAFLELDDPRAMHEPFVQRNLDVLGIFLEDGGAAAARELQHYLLLSERALLGAFARQIHQ